VRPHTVRVYAIEISYPEGSGEPGWYPARWTDPEYLKTLTGKQRREIRALLREPFKWPKERLFLAASGAHGRAWLLRFYGAQAEVRSSDPVTWRVRPSPVPSLWPFADLAQGLTSPMAAAEEEARQEEARELLREHGTMYVSDTARAAAEGERFRR
jgi:hypothetical protein